MIKWCRDCVEWQINEGEGISFAPPGTEIPEEEIQEFRPAIPTNGSTLLGDDLIDNHDFDELDEIEVGFLSIYPDRIGANRLATEADGPGVHDQEPGRLL